SSVDPDQVERVKRHLEKQKTHDVVEERVRPGVVKRRAVAKPASHSTTDVASAPAIPAPAPSVPSFAVDRASSRDVAEAFRGPAAAPAAERSRGERGGAAVRRGAGRYPCGSRRSAAGAGGRGPAASARAGAPAAAAGPPAAGRRRDAAAGAAASDVGAEDGR